EGQDAVGGSRGGGARGRRQRQAERDDGDPVPRHVQRRGLAAGSVYSRRPLVSRATIVVGTAVPNDLRGILTKCQKRVFTCVTIRSGGGRTIATGAKT